MKKERKPETTEDRIHRMYECQDLLFRSMLKFGAYTKAHGELFKRIRNQLKDDGVVFEEEV